MPTTTAAGLIALTTLALATPALPRSALAQNAPAPAAGAVQHTAPAPTGAARSGSGSMQFITLQQAGEWRASQLLGTAVWGAGGQKIGDVDEVLISENGPMAVVIGVGGFLGIGQKDVAVPFRSVQWVARNIPIAGAVPGATPSTTGAVGTTPGEPSDHFVMTGGKPDHALVPLTKEQIQSAPAFHFAGRLGNDVSPTPTGGVVSQPNPAPGAPAQQR